MCEVTDTARFVVSRKYLFKVKMRLGETAKVTIPSQPYFSITKMSVFVPIDRNI